MIDAAEFGKQMGLIVREATAPLLERIKQLEARQLERGEKGADGAPGKDAPAPTADQIATAVETYLTANPPAKGEKGDPGVNGKDGGHGRDGANGIDGKDGVAGLRGEKGEVGADGLNAEVSFEDILKAVEEVHERLVAKYVLDLERRGSDAIQRAIDKLPVPKDGKDGKDGLHGKDGLSVESLERTYDPVSHEIREVWTGAGSTKVLVYPAGGIRGKGYWRDGVTKALSGESWTHEGTMWIAVRDTSDKPSIASKDWYIGARAGRNGNDGKNGKDAQPVQLKAANGA